MRIRRSTFSCYGRRIIRLDAQRSWIRRYTDCYHVFQCVQNLQSSLADRHTPGRYLLPMTKNDHQAKNEPNTNPVSGYARGGAKASPEARHAATRIYRKIVLPMKLRPRLASREAHSYSLISQQSSDISEWISKPRGYNRFRQRYKSTERRRPQLD